MQVNPTEQSTDSKDIEVFSMRAGMFVMPGQSCKLVMFFAKQRLTLPAMHTEDDRIITKDAMRDLDAKLPSNLDEVKELLASQDITDVAMHYISAARSFIARVAVARLDTEIVPGIL